MYIYILINNSIKANVVVCHAARSAGRHEHYI